MTKPAQNPSIQDTFNSEHIDSATLHLDGARGLLMLLQNTRPTSCWIWFGRQQSNSAHTAP